LNRVKLSFLLVLYLIVCSVAESASTSKERRSHTHTRRSKTLNKSKTTQNGPAGILEQFKNYKAKDYVHVFFGFLSKFFNEEQFDTLAEKKLSDLPATVKDCFGNDVAYQEQQLAAAKSYFESAEQTMGALNTKDKKVRMCELMKYQARAVWMFQKEERTDLHTLESIFSSSYGALDEIEKNGGAFAYLNYKWFTKKETICGTFTLPNTQQFVIRKFGSIENYYNQCMYWLKASCSDYDPDSANLTEFARLAWGAAKSIMNQTQCVLGKVGSNSDFKQFLVPNLLDVASGIANGVVHYLSFGSWGAIKAGYYLIRLGIQIHEFYDKGEQTPYRVGKIFGTCATIVKSLLLGRRRRRLMKY